LEPELHHFRADGSDSGSGRGSGSADMCCELKGFDKDIFLKVQNVLISTLQTKSIFCFECGLKFLDFRNLACYDLKSEPGPELYAFFQHP
jgi:hypothetical protein